ncbi:hypothetical protein GTR04_4044 [Trichophyton interdigitale]|uniref:DUF7770 domain-containing protein n=1 Tax=Trichophyton interdigitale TaxID=101480 RepID=A0A9P4YEH1_9EURO|nr:hypothetical protein GY632_4283 [Trichophyton interdigitale]KAF3897792.1 hypothetical protein GY631_1433 [Trichophyton interdigitale]KAG8208569.1 hypothetical protein GTR04_4044 [Trichophyton interdigitale]
MAPPLKPEELLLPVTVIRVTMHTTGYFFESDTRSGNHASIFLLTGNYKSVRLNMTKAGPTDTMGTYTETRCEYESSHSSLHDIDIPAVTGLTVDHVIRLILTKGRRNYRLAPSGVGCRFLVKTIIEDLEGTGYIHPDGKDAIVQAYNDLQYNYSQGQSPEFEAIVPGTFV